MANIQNNSIKANSARRPGEIFQKIEYKQREGAWEGPAIKISGSALAPPPLPPTPQAEKQSFTKENRKICGRESIIK